MAVDPRGRVTVVWVGEDGQDAGGLWSNRYTPETGWGSEQRIPASAAEYGVQVVADPEGFVTAVWHHSYEDDGIYSHEIRSNRYAPGSGWGQEGLIAASDEQYLWNPQLVVDLDGRVTVVWRVGGPGREGISSSRYIPGRGWGTAELVAASDYSLGGQQLAVDSSGYVTLVWSQREVVPHTSNVWSNVHTPDVGWGAAEPIAKDVYGHSPDVAVGDGGTKTVVWVQHDDAGAPKVW